MSDPYKNIVTIVLLAAIAVGATFFALNEAHRHRVMTTDSIVYIDTARHIAEGKGIRTSVLTLNDAALDPAQTQYPPFYSMLLAPFIRLGTDPVFAGRLVSAIAFGMLVFVMGVWMWRTLGGWSALAAAAVLTTLPGLTSTAAAVWADSLYVLITTLVVAVAARAFQRPTAFRWFLLGSLVGIAIFTKFRGIILIGVVLALVILFERRHWVVDDWVARTGLMPALLSFLGMLLFVVPLLARNVLLDRPIGGAWHHFSSQPLGAILDDLWSTLSTDFTANWFWIALLVTAGTSVVLLMRNASSREQFQDLRHTFLTPVTLAILIYLIGLVATRWFIDTDPIHTRFVVPVYPLIAVVVVSLIASAVKTLPRRIAPIILTIITLASIGWTAKAYDFSAGPYVIPETGRIAWARENTTSRDLLIGDHSPEYTLFLNRTSLRLGGNLNDPKLTAETLKALELRWHSHFERLLFTLTPNLDLREYGDFAASLSRMDLNGTNLRVLYEEPKLVVLTLSPSPL